ncbi:S41 family peptidase [Allocoleopsis franciscana]|uniref:Periplasmic protease n=1 Tax=Allocoleopsis franciscana PCC 7113 TaxID=1173027 RepID=K9WBR9_9CYAN|nr:S41 family peptidase [Allocoleopsis franciscana]AFZ17256.1 periplasmic protease [Allocoleopsis franciscana PCC 7113]
MINFLGSKILKFITIISLIVFIIVWPIFLKVSSAQGSPYQATLNEVWQEVNDHFFDPNFNGVNWKAKRQEYENQLKPVQSLEEASVVINQMLSELKTSHTHFYTKQEPAYYQLLGIFNRGSFRKELERIFSNGKLDYTGIGIFTKDINGKIFISGVIDGTPAAQSGLKVGDEVIAVDGKPYQPIQSFANKAEQEVKVSIQQSPDPKSRKDLTVIPKKLNPNRLFLEAMRESTKIIERDNKKIGYIHIWSYAGDQYQQQLIEEIGFGKLKDADGLILDLRDGWGGAEPNYLNIFNKQVPILTQMSRDGVKRTIDLQWRKPVVMVVNNGSRSGKEILANGFKKYGIGKLIGTKTAGAVVGGSPFLLEDGNLLYLAVVNVWVDGERLEGKGVIPDIEVPFPLEYAQGKDPQFNKAVDVLFKQL